MKLFVHLEHSKNRIFRFPYHYWEYIFHFKTDTMHENIKELANNLFFLVKSVFFTVLNIYPCWNNLLKVHFIHNIFEQHKYLQMQRLKISKSSSSWKVIGPLSQMLKEKKRKKSQNTNILRDFGKNQYTNLIANTKIFFLTESLHMNSKNY